MSIKLNLAAVRKQLINDTTLVAVSKTKPVKSILEAYQEGQRVFGENKVQDMVEKYHEMPKDIHWHMIGHLQRNKVKYIASFVTLIELSTTLILSLLPYGILKDCFLIQHHNFVKKTMLCLRLGLF